jgi:ketosteroid isomerase-like protein
MLRPDHDISALDTLRSRFIAADNAGDAEALDQLLADDIVILHPCCGVYEGKEAAIAFMRQVLVEVHDEFEKHASYSRIELIVSGDMAVERGRFSQDLRPRNGSDPQRDEGMYLWVYLRSNENGWRLARIAGALTPVDEPGREEGA